MTSPRAARPRSARPRATGSGGLSRQTAPGRRKRPLRRPGPLTPGPDRNHSGTHYPGPSSSRLVGCPETSLNAGPRPRGFAPTPRLGWIEGCAAPPSARRVGGGQLRRSEVSISTAMPRRAKQRGQWCRAKNDARSRTVRPQRGQFTYDMPSPGDRGAMKLRLPKPRARVRVVSAKSQPHRRHSLCDRISLQTLAAVRIGKRPRLRRRPSDEAPRDRENEIERVEHQTPSRPVHPLRSRGRRAVRMLDK
jgi:hypothetical protein